VYQRFKSTQLTDYVDLKDDGLYWKSNGRRVGCLDTEGYRVFGFNGRQYKEHREVFFIVYGYYPNIVDHKNGVKDYNNPDNLRDANQYQNQYNRTNIIGVRKKRGKYEARISYLGKRIHIGTYNDFITARLAYIKTKNELYKEWNRTNDFF
jgi:hypothetical protein